MATTEIAYTVDGTTVVSKEFAYGTIETFDSESISDSDILEVYHEGTLLTLTTHYTVDELTESITLVPAFVLTLGDSVVLKRNVDTDDSYVTYTDNTFVISSDFNLSNLQLLYAIQELETDTGNALRYDIVNNCYDALNRKICNLASGTASTDAVNLGQVQNLIAGVDTAEIDNLNTWAFTGNGSTTNYTLTSPPSGLTDVNQLIVTVDGLTQTPTTHYTLTVGATTQVVFDTAPANSSLILIRTAEGIVSVTFPDGSIDGDAIAINSIDLTHINVGVGDALRFMVFDINGDPTARTLVHTDVGDFDAGVRTNRLDQMTAPTASVSMNTQKITGVLAGTASTDGVNKGQMDAAITAAIPSGTTDVGGITATGTTSTNLSTPVIVSNAGSTAMFVYAEVADTASSGSVTIEVKTAAGSYIEAGNIDFTSNESGMLNAIVPAGGACRISGTAGSDLIQLNTQTFS